MKKNSNIKMTLVLSISTLFLSVFMLGGATYAYFTDSVDNTSNIIQSGTLKLDFKHYDDGNWVSVRDNPNHQVFDIENFEPGLVKYNTLKIENKGNLALKYALTGSVALGTNDVGLYGQKLSDVIDVFVSFDENAQSVTDFRDDTVWSYAGTLSKVFDSKDMFSGVVLPVGEDFTGKYINEYNASVGNSTVTVAMRMKNNIDVSYQGMTLGELKLTLNATQYMYEKDAYNKDDYDKVPYKALEFKDGMTHEIAETVIFDDKNVETDVITASGAGTVVNITGGYYDVADQDCAVWAKDGATVNIYGGTYICDGLDVASSDNHQDLIYAGANDGTINIYGGTFISRDSDGAWLLNEKDNQGRIKVYAGKFVNWNPADNVSEGQHTNFLASGTALIQYQDGEDTIYEVLDKDYLTPETDENVYTLINSATVMDDTFFWKISLDDGFTFNGDGHTITGVVYEDNPLEWTLNDFVPAMSPCFSTTTGKLVTVNDITFTGTMYAVLIGHDSRPSSGQGIYSAPRGVQNSVVNNLKIYNLETFSYSIVACCALACFGKGEYNNVEVYGTTRSPYDSNSATRVLDVVAANNSNNVYNNCKFGTMYSQSGVYNKFYNCEIDFLHTSATKASYTIIGAGTVVKEMRLGGGYLRPDGNLEDKVTTSAVTVKAGATVEVLDLSYLTSMANVVIEDGANVGAYLFGGVYYSTLQEAKDALAATK